MPSKNDAKRKDRKREDGKRKEEKRRDEKPIDRKRSAKPKQTLAQQAAAALRTPLIKIYIGECTPAGRISAPEQSTDILAQAAYANAKDVLKFFAEVFGRNSYDGAGADLKIILAATELVRGEFTPVYGGKWEPELEILQLGRPNRPNFTTFETSGEYICHEFAHGVTYAEKRFAYVDNLESGALCEHVSDYFAIMFKHWRMSGDNKTPQEADWRFGVDVVRQEPNAPTLDCIRNLSDPGSLTAFNPGTADYSCVQKSPWGFDAKRYFNMGVPARAFYLATQKLGGWSFEKAGHIWYDALTTDGLQPNWGFADFAHATLRAAHNYADDAVVKIADAWREVGVTAPDLIS
jgi:Zn-dependent metalloprotease